MSAHGDAARAGHAALKAGHDRKALEFFSDAFALSPTIPDPIIYEGLALASRNLGGFHAAVAYVNSGLRHHPGHASLRLIHSLLLLGLGAWPEGWKDYEARFLSQQACYAPRAVSFKPWTGESLKGKSLLVWGEQGLGDELMFSTLYEYLFNRAGKLVIETSPRLEKFFARNFDWSEVYARTPDGQMCGELKNAQIDYEVPAGSLPLILDLSRGRLQGIRPHGAILRACPAKTEMAREIFGKQARGRKIVGISWQGGTDQTRSSARTLHSGELARLFTRTNDKCFYVSFQHNVDLKSQDCPDWLDAWMFSAGFHVWNLDHLAAMIAACDEVVTVCNTNVHLAGILGKKTTVMAPYAPEWRYGFQGDTVPWYDSVKIIRQPSYGDWAGVIDQVIQKLNAPVPVS